MAEKDKTLPLVQLRSDMTPVRAAWNQRDADWKQVEPLIEFVEAFRLRSRELLENLSLPFLSQTDAEGKKRIAMAYCRAFVKLSGEALAQLGKKEEEWLQR